MTDRPLRVAVLGGGTVGAEVVRALLEGGSGSRRSADHSTAPRFELVGVAVRNVDAARARGLPADLLTDAPAHLVAAPDSDVIVELLGGDEPALTLVTAALSAGKAVVTANKHLLARHGPALERVARATDTPLRFEAAVGAGIPVLGPLAADLGANRIDRVRGIVNGTTNFILTAMTDGGGTYEAALRMAQTRGYAEADPSGDVEGRDAVNKLVILARLAFGTWLDPMGIPVAPPTIRGTGGAGITGVTGPELLAARQLGLAIRLLASVSVGDDRRIEACVLPTAVPLASPLGATEGERNRIEVSGEPIGRVGFDGPGAGGAATSSAVLGDLLAIAHGAGSTWAGSAPGTVTAAGDDAAGGDPNRDGEDANHRGAGSPRPWFALLPGSRAGRVLAELAEAHVDVETGVAIRTAPIELDRLRSRLRDAAPETLDAQLYPIDD